MVSVTILAFLWKFRDIVLRKFQLRTKCVHGRIRTLSMSEYIINTLRISMNLMTVYKKNYYYTSSGLFKTTFILVIHPILNSTQVNSTQLKLLSLTLLSSSLLSSLIREL